MNGGLILPEVVAPMSRLIIEFHAPDSAEFKIAIEGQITPAQKFAAAGWLGSVEAKDFVLQNSTPSNKSRLALDFGTPGSAAITPMLDGRVTPNQLYSAAGWLDWGARLDFTVSAQQAAYQQQQEMQRGQQMLSRLGDMRH
jgi:hypothetical protein